MAAFPGPAQQAPNQETQTQKLPDLEWKQSLPVRWGDPQINEIGGTEVRALVAFDRRLFAANGYWMDTEKGNPSLPGPQVYRLDDPSSSWQVDLELKDRAPSGLRLYMAISILAKARFTTDSTGRPLDVPVDFLLAGVWKRGPGLDVFSRMAGSGPRSWSKTPLPGQEAAPRGTQIRAFVLHKDRVTGVDMVFAGVTSGVVLSGKYDRTNQTISWSPQPELQGQFKSDIGAKGRVSSFAECNGKLYAAAFDTIYERADGPAPAWKKVCRITIHAQNKSVTGFRGLTTIRKPSASGEVLLVGVEDNPSRIYRIDPTEIDSKGEYQAIQELDVSSFLSRALGTKATYAIVAYNNMTAYPASNEASSSLLIGLEVFTPRAPDTFGSKPLNPNARYLVRDSSGNYALRQIIDSQIVPKPKLVSVRTLAVSPFPSDPPGTVYAGGFDANMIPVHNTAWLYKGVPPSR